MNPAYAVWLLVSGGVAVFVAYLAWQRRRNAPLASALFAMMMAQAFWALTYAISWIVPSEEAGIFWLKLTYVGAVIAPVAFFILTLYYIDRYSWLTPKMYGVLFLIPFLTIVLMWTDPWHHLFFGNHPLTSRGSIYNGGPWFFINIIYLYGLVIAGALLLLRAHFLSSSFYRRQTRVLFIGAVLPLAVNIGLLLLPDQIANLDLTPFAFAVTGALFAYGIFGYRMMDLIPVSRDALVENLDEAIVVLDTEGRVVDLNPKAMQYSDQSTDLMFGRRFREAFSRWADVFATHTELEGRAEVKLERPPFLTFAVKVLPLRDRQNHLVGKLVTWQDITQQKESEEKLRVFQHAVHQNPVAILMTDPKGHIEYVNPRFVELTGYTLSDARGKNPRILKSGETPKEVYQELWARILAGQVWEGEILNRKKNGDTFWAHQLIAPVLDDQGRVTHYVAMQQDISKSKHDENELRIANTRLQMHLSEIESLHAQLREEAIRDGLTRLYNRHYMEETLEREMLRVEREPQPISVVMMDVDLFKTINDTYGHQAGDTVLQTLGTMLLQNTRISDIACRFGGDEMVVVMPGATLEIALNRAEEWRTAFAQMTFHFGEQEVSTTLSLGVACFPDQARSPSELLNMADKALYWSKVKRNHVSAYDPALMSRQANRSDSIR